MTIYIRINQYEHEATYNVDNVIDLLTCFTRDYPILSHLPLQDFVIIPF